MVSHDRTKSIGASDAPAVLLGPQFPLWAEKCGLAEPPDLDQIEAVKRGRQLEPIIARMFYEETNRVVAYNGLGEVSYHPDLSWMTATLDARQHDGRRPLGALEIKNVGEYNRAEWEEEPGPLKFQIQLQHQLAVTELKWGSLCALVGGNKLRWFDMDRDQKFIDAMIDTEAFFWTQVQERIAPPPDGSIATRDTLRRMFPQDDGETISLPVEATKWDDVRLSAKADLKVNEAQIQEAENRIKAALGTATAGVLPGGGRYTHKQQTSHHKAKEAYESSFRVLRRCKS